MLHVHRCTHSSVYLFSLLLLFQHNLHNDLSTHLLGYIHTGLHIYLPVYLHFSLLSNHKDIPVTTTASIPANGCTHSKPYLFILLFQLTAKIYPSTFQLLYMSTDIPLFLFGMTSTIIFHHTHRSIQK